MHHYYTDTVHNLDSSSWGGKKSQQSQCQCLKPDLKPSFSGWSLGRTQKCSPTIDSDCLCFNNTSPYLPLPLENNIFMSHNCSYCQSLSCFSFSSFADPVDGPSFPEGWVGQSSIWLHLESSPCPVYILLMFSVHVKSTVRLSAPGRQSPHLWLSFRFNFFPKRVLRLSWPSLRVLEQRRSQLWTHPRQQCLWFGFQI